MMDLLSSFSFLAFSSCSLRICRTTLSSSLSSLLRSGDRGGLGDLGRSSLLTLLPPVTAAVAVAALLPLPAYLCLPPADCVIIE